MRRMGRFRRRLSALGLGVANGQVAVPIEWQGGQPEWHHGDHDHLRPRRQPCEGEPDHEA
jgi:hypothetical protein